jgi:hypothetical protein
MYYLLFPADLANWCRFGISYLRYLRENILILITERPRNLRKQSDLFIQIFIENQIPVLGALFKEL